MSSLERLSKLVRDHGPIPTVRVSSAQARGRAKMYPYWDVVRYEIRINKNGTPYHHALERATSRWRSRKLADLKCIEICQQEKRIHLQCIGRLSESDAARVLSIVQ